MMSNVAVWLIVAATVITTARPAGAQALGTYSWQLQPFCNNLTLNLTQQGGIYTVDGFDDQCGAAQRAPLVGVATPNPDGSVGFGLHIVTVPGGRPVDVEARMSTATLGGPWTDSAGNSGTFAFAARTSGSARPLPVAPAVPVAPKLAWSGLTTGQTVIPVNTNVVVRSVTMAIPAAGQVKVDASGLFDIITGNPIQLTWCSISTGTTVEAAHYLYFKIAGSNAMTNAPFAGGRVYAVTPGPFTVNLVCTSNDSFPSTPYHTIQTAQLTALFVPS